MSTNHVSWCCLCPCRLSERHEPAGFCFTLVYRLSIYTRIYGRVGGGAALRSKKNEDTLNGHFHKRQQYTTVHHPYIHICICIYIYIYIYRERESERENCRAALRAALILARIGVVRITRNNNLQDTTTAKTNAGFFSYEDNSRM